MAGIYFHVPYCRKACHYCDFHFSTNADSLSEMVEAMSREIVLRTEWSPGTEIETVYFGGGTPSLLPAAALEKLLNTVRERFRLDDDAEITLEANPDDLSDAALAEWKVAGVNRLSIGIQSFREEDLRYMNRIHTAEEALRAIDRSRHAGFRDLTIDLIYGTPGMDDAGWEYNLEVLSRLELPHFSAYALTVEPRTALSAFIQDGRTQAPDEEQASRNFLRLIEWARSHGYEHYEISNFALPGRYSRHNTSYWKGVPYLGIGPSAHSFDGEIRSWNIRNNPEYLRSIRAGERPHESETLNASERFNEAVLTGLRTMWGVNHEAIRTAFGDHCLSHLIREAKPFEAKGWLQADDKRTILTDQGKLFADRIASELFL